MVDANGLALVDDGHSSLRECVSTVQQRWAMTAAAEAIKGVSNQIDADFQYEACGRAAASADQPVKAEPAVKADPTEAAAAADTTAHPTKDEPATTASAEQTTQSTPQTAAEPAKKKPLPKRKVAMHLAYLGKGYHGMQRNPGYPTIEADLETALVKCGAISEQNAGSFMKIHWMRAARTDKGVSAACQVVSAKLMVEPPDLFAARVNQHLPKQIRVFGVQRTTDGFDARKYCDKRKYEYILPAWVLDPQACSTARTLTDREALQAVAATVLAGGSSSNGRSSNGAATAPSAAVDSAADASGSESTAGGVSEGTSRSGGEVVDETASTSRLGDDKLRRLREDIAASKARFSLNSGSSELQRLNKILGQYVGTHNFHNFTVRVLSSDPAAQRYIMSFTAEVKLIGNEPWVKCVVVGQSFMLHQIRKLVGMAVAIMRGVAPEECLKLALDPDRDLNTPIAPALGLFLDETYFDAYNKRFGELHGPVTFEPFRDASESFKAEVLYPDIADTDERDLINALWLRTLTDSHFRFSSWSRWGTVRNTAATIAANRAAEQAKKARQQQQKQQLKRPASADDMVAAPDDGNSKAGSEPVTKEQRLERPGRLQGATAAMIVGGQETYGMSPHKDTQQASAARQELSIMRQEYQQAMDAEQRQHAPQQLHQGQEQKPPQVDPAELDSLYDLE